MVYCVHYCLIYVRDALRHITQKCQRVLSVACPRARKQLSTFILPSALKYATGSSVWKKKLFFFFSNDVFYSWKKNKTLTGSYSNLRHQDELCPLLWEMLSDINLRTLREYSQECVHCRGPYSLHLFHSQISINNFDTDIPFVCLILAHQPSKEHQLKLAEKPGRQIVHANTRFQENPFVKPLNQATVMEASAVQAIKKEGKIGVDGKSFFFVSFFVAFFFRGTNKIMYNILVSLDWNSQKGTGWLAI